MSAIDHARGSDRAIALLVKDTVAVVVVSKVFCGLGARVDVVICCLSWVL